MQGVVLRSRMRCASVQSGTSAALALLRRR